MPDSLSPAIEQAVQDTIRKIEHDLEYIQDWTEQVRDLALRVLEIMREENAAPSDQRVVLTREKPVPPPPDPEAGA